MITKSVVRSLYLEKRKNLSRHQLNDWSTSICDQLFSTFQFTNKHISLFLPIEKYNEINTYQILKKAMAQGSKVSIPVTKWEEQTMEHILYQNEQQIEINSFGIPEPIYGENTPTESIDFFIVPLIIFDEQGNRVGYGKGFYDRLLCQASANAIIIGISFFEAVPLIGTESSDISMHYCITPKKIYNFEKQQKPR